MLNAFPIITLGTNRHSSNAANGGGEISQWVWAQQRFTLISLREPQQDRFVLLEILILQPPGQGRRRQHPAHLQVLFCPCHPFSWRLNPPKR